ncbi:hypothetical protein I3843_13G113200 [Carya illinoinensis]|uniref:Coiled-coil domain-containing protein R3HCC1L n=1 Tax=Carya illinoinensis TaxID=32201 RepID=A0A8T1NT33_CARIL|nr:coiled-coil domain-containing protein R3HCC1L [Carya illinoinensis]KAG2674314.1 hypothetical protein I3760_13G127800 [Carya illinoinensis]KAG6632017.1 hypothetical protein CIPAW_13G129200 [Carya illinoinensis]KAG6682225.1 hypothetical protein I3842_13G127600 [Carya illinoinensis]KAG7950451.1 hypothetical protein I3843_13G113200 [Carya illinoinensis]
MELETSGAMENQREEENVENWSEAVEDLVAAGDNDGAISLLETHVSKLQTLASSNTAVLQLTSALNDLANLYSSKGFSLKADDLRSRASLLKHQVLSRDVDVVKKDQNVDQVLAADAALRGNDSLHDDSSSDGHLEKLKKSSCDEKAGNVSSDDDWEAIADRAPDELLSSQCLPRVSELSLTDTKVQTPKRRGRGTFSYKKHELYCDRLSSESIISNSEYEDVLQNSKGVTDKINSSYGTRHVLVLADFPPSTKTIELEKLFQDFADRGFVIRWVNDTTALAVFRTPAIALEASTHIRSPFKVRILDVDDSLISTIPPRDLEPPRQRPQTSARTAQRLIAHGMGLKLPTTSSGSQEYRNQEDSRRNRIATREKMRNDAWGEDLN